MLNWDSTLSPYDIDVTVSAGWVTLNGIVDWQFEKEAAELCIRKLSGVVGVRNESN